MVSFPFLSMKDRIFDSNIQGYHLLRELILDFHIDNNSLELKKQSHIFYYEHNYSLT